jgi:hypothetical protein
MEATHTRSASLVGSVKDWLELMINFLVQDGRCLSGRRADQIVDYIINLFRDDDHIMSAFAFFSTARQFIASSPRLFSSSATLGYPKLKTHSGSKKRWRALASGVFKRVSTVQSVQSAGL